MNPFDMVGLLGTLGILSITITKLVNVWANRRRDALPAGQIDRLEQRLERIEQAIDAMAVEVERISEGQRFTTKLLAERSESRSPGAA